MHSVFSSVARLVSLGLLATLVVAYPAAAQNRQGAQSAKPPKPLKSAVNMRDATLEDAALPLSETKKWRATTNFQLNTDAPALGCIYLKPSDKSSYRVDVWDGNKPDMSRPGSGAFITLDIALSACPATWGEAVALGWGPDAWAKAVAEQQAFMAEIEAEAKQSAGQKSGTPETRAAQWRSAAASVPLASDAELLALARKIDLDISSLEGALDALNSKPFNDKLVNAGGLFERINLLAQGAYKKSMALKPGPAGRPAFDLWDQKLGGVALSAMNRLEKIVYYRQYRRVRLAEAINGDAGESEMRSWSYVDFSPMWPAQMSLMDVFTQHLDGRPTIDLAFQRAIAKDLERTRPSGDPGRPFYYHVPAEPKPTWMLTPAERDSQGGNVTSNLVGAINGVGDMVRLIEKVDADVRTARVAFWKCYASRCQQPGESFYAYSYAMLSKDSFYFTLPAAMDPMVSRGLSFLGNGSIDGGPIAYCSAQGNALQGALATAAKQSAGNPVASARAIDAVMKGPSYVAWQACRDRMEYILRPRFL